MVLAQWILALALTIGAAVFLTKWVERKWPGHILPAESGIDTSRG